MKHGERMKFGLFHLFRLMMEGFLMISDVIKNDIAFEHLKYMKL